MTYVIDDKLKKLYCNNETAIPLIITRENIALVDEILNCHRHLENFAANAITGDHVALTLMGNYDVTVIPIGLKYDEYVQLIRYYIKPKYVFGIVNYAIKTNLWVIKAFREVYGDELKDIILSGPAETLFEYTKYTEYEIHKICDMIGITVKEIFDSIDNGFNLL